MSSEACIEEDVLAFLYRIRVKEKNSPEMQRDALVLSNRIVEQSNAHEGFADYKRLRDEAKRKNAQLLAHLNEALAGLEKLKIAHAQWKFDKKALATEKEKVSQACKKIAQMARERDELKKTIEGLKPKKAARAIGRRLAI